MYATRLSVLVVLSASVMFGQQTDQQAIPYSETMVVTASRAEQKLEDAPVSMSLVTSSEIDSSAATTYADLLRGLPGMNAIQVSAEQQELATRGAVKTGNNSQLVLVDGRSVYIDFLGFVSWDSLPVQFDEIERIEVLSGPGSAVWGANAMSGVINVITKKPSEVQGGLLTLGAGNRGERYARLRWGGTSGRSSYKISASDFRVNAFDRDSYVIGGTTLPSYANAGTKQPKFDARVDYDAASGALWSFRTGYAGMSGISLNSAGPWFTQNGSYFTYGELRFSKGTFDANLFVNRDKIEAPNEFSDLVNRLKATTWIGELADRRALSERQFLTYGGNARHSDSKLAVAPAAGVRQEAGVYVQDDFVVSPSLSLTAGARSDWFDTTGLVLSPRASISFKPRPDDSLRFSYGRGYRAPAEVELYADIVQTTVLPLPTGPFIVPTHLAGNRNLREEVTDSLELAYMTQLGSRLFVRSAAYYNRIKGLIQILPIAFYGPADPPAGWPLPPQYAPTIPSTLMLQNSGNVVNRGIELAATCTLGRATSLNASYTFQEKPQVSGAAPESPILFAQPPRHQASLQLNAQRSRWFGSIGESYVGGAFWSDVLDSRFWGATDSYLLTNAAIGWRTATQTAFVLKGTNLTNRPVKQHYFGDIIRRQLTAEVRFGF